MSFLMEKPVLPLHPKRKDQQYTGFPPAFITALLYLKSNSG
jgi:hypothetical protein